MSPIEKKPQPIEKEGIPQLKFPKSEVLKSKDDIKIRALALDNAMKLGNTHRGKVKIVFEDADSLKIVNTTIWAATSENVSLKGGAHIPIHRIVEINPY